MATRLLDHDPITGVTTWHEFDEVTKNTKIHYEFNHLQTDAVLDHNHRRMNDGTNGWSPTKEWKYVAEIPASVQLEWLVTRGIDIRDPNDWPKIRSMLNSSEWAKLRTSSGTI